MSNKENIAVGQHEIIGNTNETKNEFKPNTHHDAQWFINGGNLGLFIHFGIASVNSNTDLSWPMYANKPWDRGICHTIIPTEYFSFAQNFNPKNYDMDKIIKTVKDAGFTYAVLTTRHHDGFSLWPSKYSEFSTKNYINGRDLVRPFVDACNKYDIKVGLYYSPPDWYKRQDYMSFNYGSKSKGNPDKPHFDKNHKPINKILPLPEKFELEEAIYVKNQITELLTEYGKIDMLWFDGTIPLKDYSISIEEIRQMQPQIVVTPRMHGKGDFATFETEHSFPKENPNKPWEYCDIWTEKSWGYNEQYEYKSSQWAYDTYKKVCQWGGNFLLNVGPNKNGELPQVAYERIEELKKLINNN